jgi:hypothetical protein
MKCLKCKTEMVEGQVYIYTRTGCICSNCVEPSWFIPDFALGKVGFRQAILEQTQPMEDPNDSIYFG